jgi:hypothetical protein
MPYVTSDGRYGMQIEKAELRCLIINIHQTCSEILCTWYTVTSTETSKPVEYPKIFKLLSVDFTFWSYTDVAAVGECHISVFREQDLIPHYGQLSDFLSCLDIMFS